MSIRELSFNAKDKVLNLDDYYVSGLTLLNENVGPGMAGSNVQLADFESKNSVYSNFDVNTKMLEMLEKINARYYCRTLKFEIECPNNLYAGMNNKYDNFQRI